MAYLYKTRTRTTVFFRRKDGKRQRGPWGLLRKPLSVLSI